MGPHWTAEQRTRRAAAVRRWKPWESATGPVTDAGRAVSAGNAAVHGMASTRWRVELRELHALLRATVRDGRDTESFGP
ncbi:hypothetical protein HDG34_003410 [Paraburkholderia sp. HC6.4b]|nr:hypothetical protein [Paraburkholderia sp. HC6.4b]MBB5451198.1 hypothetical protein [Paraburkholderia sp. Kb1A]